MAVKQAWQLGGGIWGLPTPDAQPGARKPPAMWVKAAPVGSQRLAERSPVPEHLALRQPARCSIAMSMPGRGEPWLWHTGRACGINQPFWMHRRMAEGTHLGH